MRVPIYAHAHSHAYAFTTTHAHARGYTLWRAAYQRRKTRP